MRETDGKGIYGSKGMKKVSETTAPAGEQIVIKEGEPLKDRLNRKTLYESALVIQAQYNQFQVEEFVNSILDKTWDDLELKARMRQITMNLGKYLPADYSKAVEIMDNVVDNYSSGLFVIGLSLLDFIEVYGQDDKNWDLSMKALAKYTVYWSAEFAVRSFIIKDEERMMAQMYIWSQDENEHVRRLSSEGCRPALPWGQALKNFKNNPMPIIPILEQLKNDSSAYVRKSVANNINDISKTHPDLVIKLVKKWRGKSEYTDWIVKHGCRTLLKKGNREVLAIFGYDDTTSLDIKDFKLAEKVIAIGDNLNFSFSISTKKATKVRIEYGIAYVKSNGKTSGKIFKISEITLKENEQKVYTRKHSFVDRSVRKHYPGIHSITLIVNGEERGTLDFELQA